MVNVKGAVRQGVEGQSIAVGGPLQRAEIENEFETFVTVRNHK